MLVIVLRTTGRKHQKWSGSLALQLSKWFLFPPQCYVVSLNSFWLVHMKVIIQPTLQLPRIVTCFALMSCFILICPQLFLCSQIVTSYSFLPLSSIQPFYMFSHLITLWVILSTFTSSEVSWSQIQHISKNSAYFQMNMVLHNTANQNIYLPTMSLNSGRKVSLKTTGSFIFFSVILLRNVFC